MTLFCKKALRTRFTVEKVCGYRSQLQPRFHSRPGHSAHKGTWWVACGLQCVFAFSCVHKTLVVWNKIIKQFAAFSSAPTKTGPVSASTPAASSRTIGASSPSNKRPTFKTTATAVRTSASLQQGRKSPALRGTLGSTG